MSLHLRLQHQPQVGKMRNRVRVLRGPKASRANELWYKEKLLELVRFIAAETEQELLPMLKQYSVQWAKDSVTVGDGYSTDLSEKIASLSNKFGGLRSRAKQLAELAARRSLDSTDKQLIDAIKRSVKVDITGTLSSQGIADVMERAIITNADLISSIADQYLGRVRNEVFSGVKSGLRWESIAEKLQESTDVTENRAKLIARDQTAKMNSSFNEARQKDLGIESYRWAGAMDERSRDTHMANEGKIFRWDSPPSATGHPGDDVNCRCTALPVFDLDKEEKRLGIYGQ